MKIYWNTTEINGKRYRYEYKKSWGKKCYSFDSAETFYESKAEAFAAAMAKNALREVKAAA